MITKDVSSLTNSVFLAVDKEFRKNGMGGAYHRLAQSNRNALEVLVAMVIADHNNFEGKPVLTEIDPIRHPFRVIHHAR